MKSAPRLSIELVPKSAWGHNVRTVVAGDTWEALRWQLGATKSRPQYLRIDFPGQPFLGSLKCTYCESEPDTLQLHEEWQYDDQRQVQRLVGLRPVCPKCHLVKHMGYANTIGRSHEALAHLAAVNGWTARQARQHSDRAFVVWEKRSSIVYELDVSYLERYIRPTKIHMDWLDNPRTWVGCRLDAIIWARHLLDSDAVIVDTETTGLPEKSNVEVIELAVINMKGKLVYQGLFRPRYKILARATAIHRITNEDVKSCPSFSENVEDITGILHGRTIVAYNAKFDQEVLAGTFYMHKAQNVDARWECAMHAYRTFSESGPYLKLPCGSHRALADCRATLKLMRKMARANP